MFEWEAKEDLLMAVVRIWPVRVDVTVRVCRTHLENVPH